MRVSHQNKSHIGYFPYLSAARLAEAFSVLTERLSNVVHRKEVRDIRSVVASMLTGASIRRVFFPVFVKCNNEKKTEKIHRTDTQICPLIWRYFGLKRQEKRQEVGRWEKFKRPFSLFNLILHHGSFSLKSPSEDQTTTWGSWYGSCGGNVPDYTVKSFRSSSRLPMN